MEDKPLIEGRGIIRIGDFCRESGADRAAIVALLAAGELEGLLDASGRPFALFDDALPSTDRLRRLGLTVGDGYDHRTPRSYVEDTPDPDEPADPGTSTWTIRW